MTRRATKGTVRAVRIAEIIVGVSMGRHVQWPAERTSLCRRRKLLQAIGYRMVHDICGFSYPDIAAACGFFSHTVVVERAGTFVYPERSLFLPILQRRFQEAWLTGVLPPASHEVFLVQAANELRTCYKRKQHAPDPAPDDPAAAHGPPQAPLRQGP